MVVVVKWDMDICTTLHSIPPPSLRHSHDRRGAKLTELKGGEELSRNIGSNSTHLGHGFKLWWKRVDFGEGRRC